MSHEALRFPARGLSQRGATVQMGSVNKTIAARPHIPAAVADLWSVCSSTGRNSVQIRPRRVESKVYSHTRYIAQIKDHGWGGRAAAVVFQADCVEKK